MNNTKKEFIMEKTFTIIAVAVLLCSLVICTSCNNNESSNNADTNIADTNNTDKNIFEEEPFEDTKHNVDVFADFENSLSESGIAFEKIQKAADMIGAVEGYGYKIGEDTVELYKFDVESDSYKNAVATGKISLVDYNISFDIIIVGEYGMVNGTPETIEIFKAI